MFLRLLAFASLAFALACTPPAPDGPVETLGSWPIASDAGVLSRSRVTFDPAVSSDGNGSLRIEADAPTTVRLFETGDLDVEDARLLYRARLRSEGFEGRAYLEMWAHFPGRGEFFSRALQAPLEGSVEWSSQETPFLLRAGENPDNVRLNLVVEGTGRVWIDDVQLARAPLG